MTTDAVNTAMRDRDAIVASLAERYRGRRVAAAMSGGVDSSVAAVMLAEAGAEVVGVTMKLFDMTGVGGDLKKDGRCCNLESIDDARLVADRHGFRHYVLDLTDAFERTVIADFVSEYRVGRTPTPCTVCNTEIKWGAYWERVRELGAEAIVTGHYARLDAYGGGVRLRRGVDPERDQSYFLWGIDPGLLARTVFPLGDLHKSDVRAIARAWDLASADTPESRDICFVVDGDHRRFLAERLGAEGIVPTPGAVTDRRGDDLGRHDGVARFTIGQRRGLGIATGERAYVTDIDPARNLVVLGANEDLMARTAIVEGLRWLTDPVTYGRRRVLAQIRYRHRAQPATIRAESDDAATLTFDTPQRAITPGQSAVFYDGDTVIGGGLIRDAVRDDSATL